MSSRLSSQSEEISPSIRYAGEDNIISCNETKEEPFLSTTNPLASGLTHARNEGYDGTGKVEVWHDYKFKNA